MRSQTCSSNCVERNTGESAGFTDEFISAFSNSLSAIKQGYKTLSAFFPC
jgi:hypothetical protein